MFAPCDESPAGDLHTIGALGQRMFVRRIEVSDNDAGLCKTFELRPVG
jgi:hypothetical protein